MQYIYIPQEKWLAIIVIHKRLARNTMIKIKARRTRGANTVTFSRTYVYNIYIYSYTTIDDASSQANYYR